MGRAFLRSTCGPVGFLVALVGAVVALSCAGQGFQPESLISGVRILATRADKPFAAPGDTVHMTMLAVDGRIAKSPPMGVFWLPLVCLDPPGDEYYACFAGLAAGDAGAGDADTLETPDGAAFGGGGGGGGVLQPGVDLTPYLIQGPSFSFTLPADIIAKHAQKPGQPAYGLAIAFNVACAGHVQLLPVQPGNLDPVQLPVGCFDDSGNALGPDDYVVGFTRVYAYEPDSGITATNPVISSLTFADASISVLEPDSGPAGAVLDGGTIPHCTSTKQQDCNGYPLDTSVPAASWQVDRTDIGENNMPQHVEIWVDYFVTAGSVDDDAMLLYTPSQGPLTGTSTTYRAPEGQADLQIWAVVHNNLGGADWASLAVSAR